MPAQGTGVDAFDGDDEAQAVDGGEQPAAPHLGQFDAGLSGDERGVRRGGGVRAQVVLVDVGQPRAGQRLVGVSGVDDRGQAMLQL
jgi:hypothetical protein